MFLPLKSIFLQEDEAKQVALLKSLRPYLNLFERTMDEEPPVWKYPIDNEAYIRYIIVNFVMLPCLLLVIPETTNLEQSALFLIILEILGCGCKK